VRTAFPSFPNYSASLPREPRCRLEGSPGPGRLRRPFSLRRLGEAVLRNVVSFDAERVPDDLGSTVAVVFSEGLCLYGASMGHRAMRGVTKDNSYLHSFNGDEGTIDANR
jgi:hypothetical protein